MKDQDWDLWFDYMAYRESEEEIEEMEEADYCAARLLGSNNDN